MVPLRHEIRGTRNRWSPPTAGMLEATYHYKFNTMEVEWDNMLFASISGIPNNFASHCTLGGVIP
jgi:hypothetical protein